MVIVVRICFFDGTGWDGKTVGKVAGGITVPFRHGSAAVTALSKKLVEHGKGVHLGDR